MQTEEDTLFNVWQNVLRVPPFQRFYVWRYENMKDFWDDLIKAFYQGKEHFYGAIILSRDPLDKEDSPKEIRSEFIIIDGQQRLVTTYVMLAAIRDTLRKIRNATRDIRGLADAIDNKISSPEKYAYAYRSLKIRPEIDDFLREITEEKYEDEVRICFADKIMQNIDEYTNTVYDKYEYHLASIFKLMFLYGYSIHRFLKDVLNITTPHNEEFWKNLFKDFFKKDSDKKGIINKLLYSIKMYIETISKITANETILDKIVKFTETLRKRARIIKIKTDDDKEAYVIFEVLNYRGLQLTPLDLIRNYVYYKYHLEPEKEETLINYYKLLVTLNLISKCMREFSRINSKKTYIVNIPNMISQLMKVPSTWEHQDIMNFAPIYIYVRVYLGKQVKIDDIYRVFIEHVETVHDPSIVFDILYKISLSLLLIISISLDSNTQKIFVELSKIEEMLERAVLETVYDEKISEKVKMEIKSDLNRSRDLSDNLLQTILELIRINARPWLPLLMLFSMFEDTTILEIIYNLAISSYIQYIKICKKRVDTYTRNVYKLVRTIYEYLIKEEIFDKNRIKNTISESNIWVDEDELKNCIKNKLLKSDFKGAIRELWIYLFLKVSIIMSKENKDLDDLIYKFRRYLLLGRLDDIDIDCEHIFEKELKEVVPNNIYRTIERERNVSVFVVLLEKDIHIDLTRKVRDKIRENQIKSLLDYLNLKKDYYNKSRFYITRKYSEIIEERIINRIKDNETIATQNDVQKLIENLKSELIKDIETIIRQLLQSSLNKA